ncbi:MAG: anthrax toxin lethal factor-related metalloendopeptidase [Limisphaerales bacterium]
MPPQAASLPSPGWLRRLATAGVLLCVFLFAFRLPADEPPPNASPAKSVFDPTSAYREQQIEGWRVLVNEKLLVETNLCERTLKLLAAQLYQIVRAVPPEPLAKLRQIPIWIERSSDQFPCMCYHESHDWLSTHGVNPDKTGAVELANPGTFLAWTRDQPWMVLHELAHGYHQQFLGPDHAGIRRCFEQATASKTYESVLRIDGTKGRHYALNNEKEYFAEATEAFFGTNDFYPFTRAELKEHDPEMFKLLCEVWDVNREPSSEPEKPQDGKAAAEKGK